MKTVFTPARHMMRALIASAMILIGQPAALVAQNLFSPAVQVNESTITNYEVDQRARLLTVLRSPGNPREEAIERLIDERLQLETTRSLGILVSDAEIESGITEFAARAELSGDEFIKVLASAGIAKESFRDFVHAGLAWRSLVRAKFGAISRPDSFEVDDAMAREPQGSVRVLISELFLIANTPKAKAAAERLAPRLQTITSISGFAAAARKHSAGGSRGRGGRVDSWVPIENLPPAIRAAFLTMNVGEVTEPMQVPNAVALFQLRAIEETDRPAPQNAKVEYATYYIPGGRSAKTLDLAAKMRARTDTCNDLYGEANGQNEAILERKTLPVGEIPMDVALELAKLDAGEISTALVRANDQSLMFLMLCGRHSDATDVLDRKTVQNSLRNTRIASYASGYLADLRANALIVYP